MPSLPQPNSSTMFEPEWPMSIESGFLTDQDDRTVAAAGAFFDTGTEPSPSRWSPDASEPDSGFSGSFGFADPAPFATTLPTLSSTLPILSSTLPTLSSTFAEGSSDVSDLATLPTLPALANLPALATLPTLPALAALPTLPVLIALPIQATQPCDPVVAQPSPLDDLPSAPPVMEYTQPPVMEYTQPPVMEYIQPVRHAFDDPAGEEQAGAGTFGQSPPPDANLTQSSWSETIDDGDFPPDVESLGTAFRLRDDAGFSTFANADNPNPTPTPTATGTKPKSRLGLVSKLTASDATKRKSRSANGSTAKNKKKKMKENPDAPASTSPIASPSNVSSPNGSSSKATSSKAKALFRKAEATPVIASEDGKRKDTTRLVRILAAVSLAAGLALGAYAMFAGKATTSPPAPTRTTSVTDAGAVEVPQSAVLTDPALQNPIPGDGLDFSTGGDFSTAVDPPASGKN